MDAEAMGQVLLIKKGQCDKEWEQELAEALREAEVRCAANLGRAPWGCAWFEEWRRNVEKAVELQQVLHVFYIEGCKGKGKMLWDDLCDDDAKPEARRSTGLGACQTVEVAYLDKMGFTYVEHDITECEELFLNHM